jgi:hypothetical protein
MSRRSFNLTHNVWLTVLAGAAGIVQMADALMITLWRYEAGARLPSRTQ